ncbi:MAG TPA: glycosyltransferase family 2 protein [Xenococcaceae cyanobacterium]
MVNQVLVSVIIPAYNTENYVAQAINSALNQTLTNIEVIVVDDASTDNTRQVIQQFHDSRLKILYNQHNLGAGATRNRALRAATGEWIAVLDSDDWYAPERLAKLVQYAESYQADVIVDDLYLIDDGYPEPWSTLITQGGVTITSVQKIAATDFIKSDIEGKKGLHLGFSKPLFRRQFLIQHQIEYNPTIKVTQDFWLDMDCFLHQANFFLIPQPYYFYRSREGSLVSSDKIKRLEDECSAITQFMSNQEYLRQNPLVSQVLQEKQLETEKQLQYYRVVELVKQGKLFAALCTINDHTTFWQNLLYKLPEAIERRWQMLFGEKDLSYHRNIF